MDPELVSSRRATARVQLATTTAGRAGRFGGRRLERIGGRTRKSRWDDPDALMHGRRPWRRVCITSLKAVDDATGVPPPSPTPRIARRFPRSHDNGATGPAWAPLQMTTPRRPFDRGLPLRPEYHRSFPTAITMKCEAIWDPKTRRSPTKSPWDLRPNHWSCRCTRHLVRPPE